MSTMKVFQLFSIFPCRQMNKIRTIIVDDEPEAREGMKILLEDDTEIELLGICKNGIEALDMINDHKIDLVLLDIQMPVINGFEVVKSISKEKIPQILFVTAYDQYALKAFEVHAIDYILKPFTNERFFEGLTRAKQLIKQQKLQEEQQKLKHIAQELIQRDNQGDQLLISSGTEEGEINQRLIIKEKGHIKFIPVDDVIWLEAYDYYVKIHLTSRYFLVRESMKKLGDRLPSGKFIRVHKSSIVNKNCIREINKNKKGDYVVKLSNEIELKVSRSYKDSIKEMIG